MATGYQFGKCLVSQMGQSFVYDCEYFGSVDRLVFTPLTERVFLSLSSAIRSFHCGVLTGTAGIGKCQTITDLAVVGSCFSFFFCYLSLCKLFCFILQFCVHLSVLWYCELDI